MGEAFGWWRGAEGGRAGIREIQPHPPATLPAIDRIDMLLVIAVVRQADLGQIVLDLVAPGSARLNAERGIVEGRVRRDVSGPADSVTAVAVNSPLRRRSRGRLFRCLRLS